MIHIHIIDNISVININSITDNSNTNIDNTNNSYHYQLS